MKRIKLSKGKVALVDEISLPILSGNKWVVTSSGTRWYAIRGRGEKRQYMHRLLAEAPKGKDVDHINGNTLDNRLINLRVCTRQQNTFNAKSRNPKSGYKGVAKYNKKWGARLTINGKNLYLGVFDTPEEAARKYDSIAKSIYGEFARTNF